AGERGWDWSRFKEFISLGILLGLAAVVAYLPYFVGFASQAGGLIPNLLYPTRGAQLWVMWAPLWLPLFFYFIYRVWRSGQVAALLRGILIAAAIFISLWLFSLALPTVIPAIGTLLAPIGGWLADSSVQFISQAGLNLQAAALSLADVPGNLVRELWPFLPEDTVVPSMEGIISESLSRRWSYAGGWLSLFAILSLTIALLFAHNPPASAPTSSKLRETSGSAHFILLLVFTGAMLVIVPEFVYIRDFFGYRINTIFKFYYMAWLFMALAAAFGTAYLLTKLKPLGFTFYLTVLLIALALGLPYTIYGVWDRAQGFDPNGGFRVDGAVGVLSPDDAAAAEWLRSAPLGVIAEAVGGSYSSAARISSHSGQPAVLGWSFHETQWRGGETEKGAREHDIFRLYTSSSWDETMIIIQQYDIRYIVIGNLERSTYQSNDYQVNEAKFLRHLSPVFQMGGVTIYEVAVN
ncbi:MAG: DUF2298 domain-containing protein, partial [Anaerolineae bacterium]|nr:DUF2298 domain-containing protein [Anaerolineae bacterium]